MRPSLDDLRRLRPDLALALYALEPGQGVTLEVHHDNEVYTFRGPTESDAILAAFPQEPAKDETPAPPEPGIFD